ncbi:MAG: hypothetical protein EAZ08_13250 [Cytophagales bacterium]|nr:MAG: hypothetical protein EAZ08_13250 [Cytophagales bacterium]
MIIANSPPPAPAEGGEYDCFHLWRENTTASPLWRENRTVSPFGGGKGEVIIKFENTTQKRTVTNL